MIIMKAVHTPGLEESYWSEAQVTPARGTFEVQTIEENGQRRFVYVCPGCATMGSIAIRPVVAGSAQSWDWNGSVESPTLTPSINHVGCWHGWLTNGEFISC